MLRLEESLCPSLRHRLRLTSALIGRENSYDAPLRCYLLLLMSIALPLHWREPLRPVSRPWIRLDFSNRSFGSFDQFVVLSRQLFLTTILHLSFFKRREFLWLEQH